VTWTQYMDRTAGIRKHEFDRATDAGNRHMRANDRTEWNAEDWQIALQTLAVNHDAELRGRAYEAMLSKAITNYNLTFNKP
jgi:hypothetical protein